MNFVDWQAAAGEATTIEFDEVPHLTILSDQFASLGINFSDGTDITLCCDPEVFAGDGAGLMGNDDIHLEFAQPMYTIGVHFPGDVQFLLYFEGNFVYESSEFSDPPPNDGAFGGLVSHQPFDSVVIVDPEVGGVFIDDLHFGPPIPAPGAFGLLALAAFTATWRRRRC